jgi:hypothetical protein
MAQDPFKSLIKDPKLYPAPEKMRANDILAYESIDMRRIQQTLKNFKGSLIYMGNEWLIAGATLGLFFVAKMVADGRARTHLVGHQGNGGDYLNMFTNRSTKDYAYNREFQRMRYLTEVPVADDANLGPNRQLLEDLRVSHPPLGANKEIIKSAPHPKYYWWWWPTATQTIHT